MRVAAYVSLAQQDVAPRSMIIEAEAILLYELRPSVIEGPDASCCDVRL
jgi:hypothetical protein